MYGREASTKSLSTVVEALKYFLYKNEKQQDLRIWGTVKAFLQLEHVGGFSPNSKYA